MEKERVRIVDIAEELGVSTATVSNVIHGKTEKVSKECVKRVQELLEKRGYIPSMAGILLAQNNSKIIGIVVNNHEKYEGRVLEDGFISASVNALSKEIDRSGHFMMVKVTSKWNEIARFASMWNMEGLVIIGFCEQDYQKLREAMHIPFVVYDGYFNETPKICNLVIDHYDGGYQVGEYLKDMGHKKVLCIADNDTFMDSERMKGCIAGIKECIGEMKECIGEMKGCIAGMKGCVAEMDECAPAAAIVDYMQIPLQKEERMRFYQEKEEEILGYTAVFAVSDFYAVELIHYLQKRKIRVPDDISVVGFDDSPLCHYCIPALTTVRQDADIRARHAVAILKNLKEGTQERITVKLPVTLIKRDSVKRVGE